jgi:fructose-specific PTS system IIC-like component
MAAVAVPVCTPPLGLGLATLIKPKKFNVEEREAGKAALIMGTIGITEGAIPFAAADPVKVIPSIVAGGAAASITSLLLGAANHAPWGGLIVLPVVTGRIQYFIAVLVGMAVTALVVTMLKKNVTEDVVNTSAINDEVNIEFD